MVVEGHRGDPKNLCYGANRDGIRAVVVENRQSRLSNSWLAELHHVFVNGITNQREAPLPRMSVAVSRL